MNWGYFTIFILFFHYTQQLGGFYPTNRVCGGMFAPAISELNLLVLLFLLGSSNPQTYDPTNDQKLAMICLRRQCGAHLPFLGSGLRFAAACNQ